MLVLLALPQALLLLSIGVDIGRSASPLCRAQAVAYGTACQRQHRLGPGAQRRRHAGRTIRLCLCSRGRNTLRGIPRAGSAGTICGGWSGRRLRDCDASCCKAQDLRIAKHVGAHPVRSVGRQGPLRLPSRRFLFQQSLLSYATQGCMIRRYTTPLCDRAGCSRWHYVERADHLPTPRVAELLKLTCREALPDVLQLANAPRQENESATAPRRHHIVSARRGGERF